MNASKICLSVCAKTVNELIDAISRATKAADLIEVRFDCLSEDELNLTDPVNTAATLRRIFEAKTETPWISTLRSRDQGGNRQMSDVERSEFWRSPVPSEFVDIEEDLIADFSARKNVERICSLHDFSGVPTGIFDIYERLASTGAEIIKIAFAADDVTDTIAVWKLLISAKLENKKLIPIAMGDAGRLTRILGPAKGAFLTFASADDTTGTAPGQLTAEDLIDVYRVKNLDEDTQVYGVLGDPIAQSLSPYMHNPAFAEKGLNAVFVSLLVKNIGEFMRRMVNPATREVELNFGGFSVTMPHKQSIMPFLDEIDPTAAAIGAVNTVKIESGRMTGFNTDAHGFISPLLAKYGDVKGARVAVVGAGGAARAVVYSLKQNGADVTVIARDAVKAESFASEFEVRHAVIDEFELTSEWDILVDSTPLGMKGPAENHSLFTAEQLAGVKFVFDLVTKPIDTPILREAKVAGKPALGGIEMLVAQGVRQFEIWTGGDAPADIMKNAVLDRMRSLQK